MTNRADRVTRIYTAPTAKDLKSTTRLDNQCLCGRQIEGVTTFEPLGRKIMGKYAAVSFHMPSAQDGAGSHYTDYWKHNYPEVYAWWLSQDSVACEHTSNWLGTTLIVRGAPPRKSES